MAKSLRVGSLHLRSTLADVAERIDSDTPFRILVIGDFRGNGASADRLPLGERKPVLVDRDNFNEVLAGLAPEVQIPVGANQDPAVIRFQELDDFEPGRLFQRLDLFSRFADLRRRLHHPTTFAAAVDEIKSWAGANPSAEETTASAGRVPEPSRAESLTQFLDDIGIAPTPSSRGGSDWDRFIQTIIAPHVVQAVDPRLADFDALLDQAIGARMRSLLHHPDFQALEAVWRGLSFLIRRLESDAQLKVFALDISKEELTQDLRVDDLSRTSMHQQVVQRTVGTPGGPPWAAIVGQYTFGPTQEDLETLANGAQLAGLAGAPFLTGAHGAMVGCPSLAEATDPDAWRLDPALAGLWQQLRQLPQARFLGLALPRFLLRLPFGKDTTGFDAFAFEEMPAGSAHESYLWGNPHCRSPCSWDRPLPRKAGACVRALSRKSRVCHSTSTSIATKLWPSPVQRSFCGPLPWSVCSTAV
jgi:type VI secretion system protein ImpC